jgi:formate dehydrogenase subunit gamma
MATPPERRLPRFGRTERTLHWVHATAFLMLLATGLCLYLPSLAESVGRRPLLKSIHIYTAVAWAVAIVVVVLAGDRRALRAAVRELDRLDSGRLNVGQKLNAIITAAFAILFSVTGVLLWYGERDTRFRLPTALLVHDWLMDVSLFLFAGHLFLALIYPKTRHALSGMTRGWVDANWARRNHPRWAASLTDGSTDGGRRAELYLPVTPGPPPAHGGGE